jgi:hypothetical protein
MNTRRFATAAGAAAGRACCAVSGADPQGRGKVLGVIGEGCLTLRERRAIRTEKARVLRRSKRGLPL